MNCRARVHMNPLMSARELYMDRIQDQVARRVGDRVWFRLYLALK